VTTRPDPLRLPLLEPDDADYAALRTQALERVSALSSRDWTDHNDADPGITLLEVIAWGLADVHYRVSERRLDGWPMLPGGPALSSPVASPSQAVAIAEALALPSSTADGAPALAATLAVDVDAAPSRTDAQRLVHEETARVGRVLAPSEADSCVTLLRAPRLLRAALDHVDLVRSAVEEAAAGLPAGASNAEIDAEAAGLLRQARLLDGLWDDELGLLLARQRRREELGAVVGLAAEIRSARTDEALDRLRDRLVAKRLDIADARRALALSSSPGTRPPEAWESLAGATRIWPPTPDQSLRCEPVTGDDYGTRARSVDGVRRAWAVAGALPGIAWHGGPTVVTDRAGTVTILVERGARRVRTDESDPAFLRRVLDGVLEEAASPWAGLGRRRVLGDEVGVALLRHHPVLVEGVLHTRLGADRAAVVRSARERLERYFSEGRPERSAPKGRPGVGRGPWPSAPQPASGWVPGEPIPVTELVQVLAADDAVIGVSDARVSVKDGPVLQAPVDAAATTELMTSGLQTVDGVALSSGMRVLLTRQPDDLGNGVYTVAAGRWNRSPDLSTADSMAGAVVVASGGSQAGRVWEQMSDAPLLLDTHPLLWERTGRRVLEAVKVVAVDPVSPSGQPVVSGVRLFAATTGRPADRVLLTAQPDPADNGIYEVSPGAWSRSADAANAAGVTGAVTRALAGEDPGSTWSMRTPPPVQVGTTAQFWVRTGAVQPPGTVPSGEITIPRDGVPVLADRDCLQVRLTPGTEDLDA